MRIFAALFLAGAAALAALPAAPARAELASFDGESVTYARGGTFYRGALGALMDGTPSWRTVFSVPGEIEAVSCLPPEFRRCLVVSINAGERNLAEIDAETGAAVADGFTLSAGALRANWYDDDRLILVSDAAPGSTGRDGAAPQLVQLWQRGAPARQAETILRTLPGSTDLQPIFDVSTGGIFYGASFAGPDGAAQLYHFGWQQNLVTPDTPPGAVFQDFFQARAIVLLRASWTIADGAVPAGSLAAYPMAAQMGPGRVTAGQKAYDPPAGYGIASARGGRDRLYILLRGAGGDRLVDVRVGQPNWLERRVDVPGSGPMELLAVSKLADIALVRRGDAVYAVGRGRAREVPLPE